LRGVLEDLSIENTGALDPDVPFAEVFDSMAMVEFLGIVSEDCRCEISSIEEAVNQQFGTVRQLASAMVSAGLAPARPADDLQGEPDSDVSSRLDTSIGSRAARQLADLQSHRAWPLGGQPVFLTGVSARLPRTIQTGPELDAAVGRPTGWLERRAGILQRRIWAADDPIDAAAQCALDALRNAQLDRSQLGALIVVSEAPPLAVGLAAAIHSRIELQPNISCYELGGACTGFLSALALARSLALQAGPILIVSVEAHSQLLPLELGPYGESAALFGDGCVAVVLHKESNSGPQVKLIDLATFADGGAADLIRVQPRGTGGYCLEMEGVPLTEFALHALSAATRELVAKHSMTVNKLQAIVAHGGNGRMPAMLARLLHVPSARVWSEVMMTGNLGSASVPVAWASRPLPANGPVIWTAVGAGLVWGAALWAVGE
jgi:3-oxoacyl-[acyl-carrier-protein] synthase-3